MKSPHERERPAVASDNHGRYGSLGPVAAVIQTSCLAKCGSFVPLGRAVHVGGVGRVGRSARSALPTGLGMVGAIGVAVGLLGGCAENNSSVFISGNLAGEVTDGGCLYDPSGLTLNRGIFNPRFRSRVETLAGARAASTLEPDVDSYQATLRVDNALRNLASNRRSDPNEVITETVEVLLLNQTGEVIDFGGASNPFTENAQGSRIPSGTDTTASRGFVPATVIPNGYGPFLPDGTVVARIRLNVRTGGGRSIRTGPYEYAIQVCASGECLAGCVESPTDDQVVPCNPGQDSPTLLRCSAQ